MLAKEWLAMSSEQRRAHTRERSFQTVMRTYRLLIRAIRADTPSVSER